ncbi:hypothetical protein VP01_2301g6 [Puccinia sorghi]|uniref:Uncharacterized protein n=1 Tax=Puccinia sorghi TaxID=27349 RepID=A0A0L6V7Y2_9BASI|nr:hypothetical protein VP01_2301g6 [Puccinia sorghi]
MVSLPFSTPFHPKYPSNDCFGSPSFLLRPPKSFKSLSTVYLIHMVMEILDSGAFFQQWNAVKTYLVKATWRINNNIPPPKWLRKMDHRQGIVNRFQRPVFFLCGRKKFNIVSHLLNSCQWKNWALALLKETDKSKPTPPIIGSTKLSSQVTHSWRSDLKD